MQFRFAVADGMDTFIKTLCRRRMDVKMTSKERAKLKGYASTIDTIFQVGKGKITENVLKQIDDALRAREMIKIRVLENSLSSAKEIAQELMEAMEQNKMEAELIQVIGTKIVLYRQDKKEPKFIL